MWQPALKFMNQGNTVVVGPSVFALQLIPDFIISRCMIPNAINPDLYRSITISDDDEPTRRGNWIFHACWERGGGVAARVFSRYAPRKTMWVAAYEASESCPTDVDIQRLGSLSKADLRQHLLQCDYFVYPLVSDSGIVHHDTFACVVLEAMACGVIVVSWKSASLPEWYGQYAVLLDPPTYTEGSPGSAFGRCPDMNSDAAIECFLNVVTELDAQPVLKRQFRERAAEWARMCTWAACGDLLDNVLMTVVHTNNKVCDMKQQHMDAERFMQLRQLPNAIPPPLRQYLADLRDVKGFNPKVIYDIGSCVLHFADAARQVWPDAVIILFEAIEEVRPHYEQSEFNLFHVGALTDMDNKQLTFYKSFVHPGGSSYYREIGNNESHIWFSEHDGVQVQGSTLTTVVDQRGFPHPDLVKIDVQGAEHDIIKGGEIVLQHAQQLIVEMQHTDYNLGAPHVETTLPYIESLGFRCVAPRIHNNGPDADYGFEKVHEP
jgi:FkbM family methyltransferase